MLFIGKGLAYAQESKAVWLTISSENFDVYFKAGFENNARNMVRAAESTIDDMQDRLDMRISSKIQLLLFNTEGEMAQLIQKEELRIFNIGGVTKINKNAIKILVDGSAFQIQKQLANNISAMLIDEMIFGSSIQDKVQYNTLLELPLWYKNGLTAYLSGEWNSLYDSHLRDAILSKPSFNLNMSIEDDPVFTGMLFWKFISEKYGEPTISNILYITKISRSVENGLFFVLGKEFSGLGRDIHTYYSAVYKNDDEGKYIPRDEMKLRNDFKGRNIISIRANDDGRYMAFVVADINKNVLWVWDIKRNTYHKVFTQRKIVNGNSTLQNIHTAWVKKTKSTWQIFFIYNTEKGNYLASYNISKTTYSTTVALKYIDVVHDMDATAGGKKILITGVHKGRNDVFLYDLKQKNYDNLTRDAADESFARFDTDSNNIIFLSNKANIASNIYYAYRLDLNHPQASTLISTVPAMQLMVDSANYYVLNDTNGIMNVVEIGKTSGSVYAVTNLQRSIASFTVSPGSGHLSYLVKSNGSSRIYSEQQEDTSYKYPLNKLQPVFYKRRPQGVPLFSEAETLVNPTPEDTTSTQPYYFISGFNEEDDSTAESRMNAADNKKEKHIDSISQKYPYVFMPDHVVLSFFENSNHMSLIDYFPLPLSETKTFNTPLYASFKMSVSDLYRNHQISGGARLSAFLNSNDEFFSYENMKHRVQWKTQFYHFSKRIYEEIEFRRFSINDLSVFAKYPFRFDHSLNARIYLRRDNSTILSTEKNKLLEADRTNLWTGIKFSYTYDNTVERIINIPTGLRGTFFCEFMKNLSQGSQSVTVIGGDIRYYKKIHRTIVWANRLNSQFSFGQSKILYQLGGVDQWLFPKYDYNNQVSITQNYAFRVLASNMRGFKQNVRNGNNFAVINSELRIPVFSYLLPYPLRSDILQKLVVMPFVDVGTAWSGANLFSSKNNYSEKYFGVDQSANNYVDVTVRNLRNPLIGCFGLGLRTKIFGYYIRMDWAKGVEDGRALRRMYQLSLGLDF